MLEKARVDGAPVGNVAVLEVLATVKLDNLPGDEAVAKIGNAYATAVFGPREQID